jgi:cell wall-associated NlpC family hydrolase
MKKYLSIALLSACAWVHAAPGQPEYASMDRLLAERGLVSALSNRLQSARESVSDRASLLVSSAMGLLGVPYSYGGNDVDSGLDCSGLVRLVYEQSLGKILPRRAAEQAAATEAIDSSELKPGDLVFFNTMKRAFSHVGIYVGEGKFIHAPRSGAQVRIEDMRLGYWTTRFNGARRVPVNGN